jgi:hypothetical protein
MAGAAVTASNDFYENLARANADQRIGQHGEEAPLR